MHIRDNVYHKPVELLQKQANTPISNGRSTDKLDNIDNKNYRYFKNIKVNY